MMSLQAIFTDILGIFRLELFSDISLYQLFFYRLTPAYGMMILIQATLFVYFGTGPLWHYSAEAAADVCREYWWSGLLYVQNFATPLSTVSLTKW